MHFFTEPDKLDVQGVSDPFGPLDGDEANKFRVSSKHKIFVGGVSAKLFACQDSQMLVLPHVEASSGIVNTNLVNLVLKPMASLEISMSPVKYYIYRGVDINSFISGVAITDTASNSELIESFWDNWAAYAADMGISPTPPPTPQSFGYDPNLSSSPQKEQFLEEYFNSAESTNLTINDFQALSVKEGEWIGNFLEGVDFEFEIIVDTDHVTMDLEYAQKSVHIVDATGLSIDPVNPDIDAISAREVVLNYIDPAAFYGMHNKVGASQADWTGGIKNPSIIKKDLVLATDLLQLFLNKDVVYLDLRGDKGYSYYYYQNYRLDIYSGPTLQWSETFKLKSKSDTSFAYMDYAAMDWPLINLNAPQFSLNPIVPGEYLELKLSVKNNDEPLVFVENPKLLGDKNTNNFVQSIDLLDPAPLVDYTLPFKIHPPFYNDGTNDINFAHHLKIQYFQADNNITATGTFFTSNTYLDNAYGAIELDELDINTPFQHIQNAKRNFVNSGKFSFVNKNGVFQDSTRLLFYSENAFSLKSSGDNYPKINPSFDAQLDLLQYKNVAFGKVQINDGVNNIDILTIKGYNRDSSGVTPKENLMLLGLLKSELTDLNGLSGVSSLHHKYFVLTELFDVGNPFVDSISSITYRKFRVDIQGIDATTGQVTTIDSSVLTNDVFVYGLTDYVLCSAGFAAVATLPYDLPDPGVIRKHPAFGEFEYDSTDADVVSLFPGTRAGHLIDINDSGNNQGFPTIDAEIRGLVRFPTNEPNKNDPGQIAASCPLIVIVHGNGQRYTWYAELAEFLAVNGYIVASISLLIRENQFTLQTLPTPVTVSGVVFDKMFETFGTYYYSTTNQVITRVTNISGTFYFSLLPWAIGVEFSIPAPTTWGNGSVRELIKVDSLAITDQDGMTSLGRSSLLFAHLEVLKAKFTADIQNNIGLLGHSRGGETVVKAANLIGASSAPSTLNNIKAIMSMAPTDQYDMESLVENIPYYVLFGSMDGDTTGIVDDLTGADPNNRTGGFSLYDRAINTTEKSMTFVQGGSHNGFVINHHDYYDFDYAYGAYSHLLMDVTSQKQITKAYSNAFFRMHLNNEQIWRFYMQGTYIPESTQYEEIIPQYKKMQTGEVDDLQDFEAGSNIGSTVNKVKLLSHEGGSNLNSTNLDENKLVSLNIHTPHDTKGLLVKWAAGNILQIKLATFSKDITSYNYLSFRIGHAISYSTPEPASNHEEVVSSNLTMYDPSTLIYYSVDAIVAGLRIETGALPYRMNPVSDLVDIEVTIQDKDDNFNYVKIPQKVFAPTLREIKYNGFRSRDDKGTAGANDDEYTISIRSASKSHLQTMIIPLAEFANNGVILSEAKWLKIKFPSTGSGELLMDSFDLIQ
ncbi:MAG: dienelactone hydrolase [Crocinitomicaceae bacterium]|jgi:dienelactone hydrolase